jgi:hypothetical protein
MVKLLVKFHTGQTSDRPTPATVPRSQPTQQTAGNTFYSELHPFLPFAGGKVAALGELHRDCGVRAHPRQGQPPLAIVVLSPTLRVVVDSTAAG